MIERAFVLAVLALAAVVVTLPACSANEDQCSAPICKDHCGRSLTPNGCNCSPDPSPGAACPADAGHD